MPDQVLYESILTSKKLRQCDEDTQDMWPRMLVGTLDDHGNFEIDPEDICKTLYKFRPRHTPQMVFERLQQMERAGFILCWVSENGTLYGHAPIANRGRRYLRRSRVPSPPWEKLPTATSAMQNFSHFCELFQKDLEVPGKVAEDPGKVAHGIGVGVGIGDVKEMGEEAAAPAAAADTHTLPQDLLVRAEQFVGSPLSAADLTRLRRFVYAERAPTDWILAAFDAAESQGVRRIAYVAGILRGYHADGGPPQKVAACARGQPAAPPAEIPAHLKIQFD